jgi:hypothetical protein
MQGVFLLVLLLPLLLLLLLVSPHAPSKCLCSVAVQEGVW